MSDQAEGIPMDKDGAVNPAFGVWQPIETAPKDGTQLLLFFPEGEEMFDADHGEPGYSTFPVTAVMHWEDNGWEGYYSGAIPNGPITHWMPLPPPPDDRTDASPDQSTENSAC